MLWPLIAGIAGAVAGALVCWLVLRERCRALGDRLADRERRLEEIGAIETDSRAARESAARAEERAAHADRIQGDLRAAQTENTELKTRLAETGKAREADQEKLLWLERAQKQMSDAFEALASKALQSSSTEFLKHAQTHVEKLLETVKGDWGAHKEQIGKLVEPISTSLQGLDKSVRELEAKREGAYQGLGEQLRQLADNHRSLQTSTDRLGQALRNPAVRGRWGELQLRRVAELAGMEKHVDFDEQVAGDEGRPDMIVHLPHHAVLPVDSKTPMDSYQKAVEANDDEARRTLLQEHAQAMRARVRELGTKRYWEQFERAPDLVVMFVPNEACLGAAFQADPDLFEAALKQHVVVASPFTLYALLRACAYGWQQQQIAENARLIAEQGRELYERLSVFLTHVQGIGKALKAAVEAHNKAVGSLEARLLPSAAKFQELAAIEKNPPAIECLEVEPRLLTGTNEASGEAAPRDEKIVGPSSRESPDR